jgi:peroxiredoxin
MSEQSSTITWQTNEPATSQVKICISDVCISTEPDNPLVASHSATLTDLKPDTGYHFTLISRDKSGNEAKLEIELITPPPPYVPPPPISTVEVSPEIGKPAPDFTLPTLDGKQLSLSQFRGKKVMVNFWQSSCSACRTEVPYIQAVYNRWSRDDLEILAVSVGERTPFVQSFVDRQGLTFPVLLDSDEAVSKTYQVPSYPTTFFINADGIIKKMKDGRFSGESEIEDILNSL